MAPTEESTTTLPAEPLLAYLAARYPALTPDQLDTLQKATDRAAAKLGRDAAGLSATLQRARRDAGLTQQLVAAYLYWSVAKLSRIESDQVGISITDLRALLARYGISDARTVNGLVEQARARRRLPLPHP